jgi:DNA-binding NarL/FixJ family response regulator
VTDQPVRVAIVDDYDVIVEGTAAVLAPHGHLVRVVEVSSDGTVGDPVDVALLDAFGRPEATGALDAIRAHPAVGRVAIYTWSTDRQLVDAALRHGADSFLSKSLGGRELAKALVDTHRGERVVLIEARPPLDADTPRRWPGKDLGLSEREAEVLSHITQGRRPTEIAAALYLSPNTVKTYTRSLYRMIGVSDRTEAALFGVDHGFRPDRDTRSAWSARPTPA